MILSTGRSTTSRNASATLAFNQFRQAQQEEIEKDAMGRPMPAKACTEAAEPAVEAPRGPKREKQSFPITLAAASASTVRKGAKLDRAVILNDITKIARLALKFELSLDSPACAYALFQGLRTAESAQWCSKNFHKKLLPILAEKEKAGEIENKDLEVALCRTLEAMDSELMLSAHAFSGCGAALALVLGDRLVVAGIGRVRVALLHEKGPARPILKMCAGDPDVPEELARIRGLGGGAVRGGQIIGTPEGLQGVERILAARSVFHVLQFDSDGPLDVKAVRSVYRKLALQVHPDKLPEGADRELANMAFARLDSAKEALEAMLDEDKANCQEFRRVLCSDDVVTRSGAAALLGTEDAEEAEKASKTLWKALEPMRRVAPDFERAEAVCREAAATLKRGFSEEALPRQEALVREGLPTTRAMGARDLREPYPLVLMKPEAASKKLPNSRIRVALLCGATAALSDAQLAESATAFPRHPKASALRWCAAASAEASCSSAVCLYAESGRLEEPAAKRQRTAAAGKAAGKGGQEGTARVRHILFSHQQLQQPDPSARRQIARTVAEAEAAALSALERLLKAESVYLNTERDPNLFLRLCREMSDCQSAMQAGTLAGDLGWIGKGQQEPGFDDVAFSIGPNTIGDLATTSRGIHIIQRLA